MSGAAPSALADTAGAPSEAVLAALKENCAEVERYNKLLTTNTLASHATSGAATGIAPGHRLAEFIHEYRPKGCGTSLLNMAQRPTPENVGESKHFEAAMRIVLKKVGAVWDSKTWQIQHDVLSWHYLQLVAKYENWYTRKAMWSGAIVGDTPTWSRFISGFGAFSNLCTPSL